MVPNLVRRQACKKPKRIHFSSFLSFFLQFFGWHKKLLGAVPIKNKKYGKQLRILYFFLSVPWSTGTPKYRLKPSAKTSSAIVGVKHFTKASLGVPACPKMPRPTAPPPPGPGPGLTSAHDTKLHLITRA
jgi:hypothetical protein